jgi:hypothetical protein
MDRMLTGILVRSQGEQGGFHFGRKRFMTAAALAAPEK